MDVDAAGPVRRLKWTGRRPPFERPLAPPAQEKGAHPLGQGTGTVPLAKAAAGCIVL